MGVPGLPLPLPPPPPRFPCSPLPQEMQLSVSVKARKDLTIRLDREDLLFRLSHKMPASGNPVNSTVTNNFDDPGTGAVVAMLNVIRVSELPDWICPRLKAQELTGGHGPQFPDVPQAGDATTDVSVTSLGKTAAPGSTSIVNVAAG